jgi:hypothetical protein
MKQRCFDKKKTERRKIDQTTRHLILVIFFIILSPESCSGGHIFRTFNASSINQTIHQNDGLTLDHTLIWFFLADWQHNNLEATPKRSTQAALSCQNLIAHDDNFELIVWILSVRIKGQYLTPVKIKYLSSTLYK